LSRYRIARVVLWPVVLPDLERRAAEQHRVHLLVDRGDELTFLVVAVWRLPATALEPETAVLVGITTALVHAIETDKDHRRQFHGTEVSVERWRAAVSSAGFTASP